MLPVPSKFSVTPPPLTAVKEKLPGPDRPPILYVRPPAAKVKLLARLSVTLLFGTAFGATQLECAGAYRRNAAEAVAAGKRQRAGADFGQPAAAAQVGGEVDGVAVGVDIGHLTHREGAMPAEMSCVLLAAHCSVPPPRVMFESGGRWTEIEDSAVDLRSAAEEFVPVRYNVPLPLLSKVKAPPLF